MYTGWRTTQDEEFREDAAENSVLLFSSLFT
jgi:hypothetical protein